MRRYVCLLCAPQACAPGVTLHQMQRHLVESHLVPEGYSPLEAHEFTRHQEISLANSVCTYRLQDGRPWLQTEVRPTR